MKSQLTSAIERGLACSNTLLMPFLRADTGREALLHEIGTELKVPTQTIHPERKNERYASVLFEKRSQLELV